MEYLGRKVRHEIKYYINEKSYFNLRKRLELVMDRDSNMEHEEGYLVSSVYFDDVYQSALEEKQAGVRFRKKYRLRCYDRDDGLIRIECKRKYENYIAKEAEKISRREYDALIKDDYDFLLEKDKSICRELYALHHSRLLRPVITVEYLREAYVSGQGNVRVTFDKDISFSVGDPDVFSEYYSVRRALEQGLIVMEVKYDEFMPDVIMRIVRSAATDQCAISKYVMCRNEKRRFL